LIVGLKHASRSVVLCTHDLDEAERLADQVAILRHGRVVALDTTAALRATASRETLVQLEFSAHCSGAASIAARIEGVTDPLGSEPLRLSYRTTRPSQTNPQVIAALVAAGAAIVSVTCTTATLEDVYATALTEQTPSPSGRGRG
jgi:ABC-2 type transport system ATP-binding protein